MKMYSDKSNVLTYNKSFTSVELTNWYATYARRRQQKRKFIDMKI